MAAEPKIYVFLTGRWERTGDVMSAALAEDGTGLGGHLSSSESWAKHDMGVTSNRKHEGYREHYPHGYEVVWLDNPEADAGWQAAHALNQRQLVEQPVGEGGGSDA
jgi:hypothetical protein